MPAFNVMWAFVNRRGKIVFSIIFLVYIIYIIGSNEKK